MQMGETLTPTPLQANPHVTRRADWCRGLEKTVTAYTYYYERDFKPCTAVCNQCRQVTTCIHLFCDRMPKRHDRGEETAVRPELCSMKVCGCRIESEITV